MSNYVKPMPVARVRVWYASERGCWLVRVPILAGAAFYGFATLREAVDWVHQR